MTSRVSEHLVRRYYPEVEFGGYTRASPVISFYTRVNALLREDDAVLDVGCGRGAWLETEILYLRRLRTLKGKCRSVIGADVSEDGRRNPSLDEFRRIDTGAAQWPVRDAEVDMVVADSVLEHIASPSTFLDECHRALKPGGVLCIRTYNAMHYIGIISRLLPNRMHVSALSVAQPYRQEADVFPTYYRCNTLGRLRRALRGAGFDGCVYSEEPNSAYLSFSPIVYWASVMYQRCAPSAFRWNLLAFARRLDDVS